jgi:hypothetical protein
MAMAPDGLSRLKSSILQFDNTDPLWNETPTIGTEGLIATIDDKNKLIEKLVELNEYHKKLKKLAN